MKISPGLKSAILWRVKAYGGILLFLIILELFPFELLSSNKTISKPDFKAWQLPAGKIPIVYSDAYNIGFWGLEKLHPFDSKKYLHVFEALGQKFGWTQANYLTPDLPTWDLLSVAVSDELFWKLQNPYLLARYTEVSPVIFMPRGLTHLKVVNPMRVASLGSVMAAKLALKNGWAINLGGGFHHAHGLAGGGFCLIPDISLIVHWLRNEEHLASKVMIVDLDAHQGNGHERDFAKDRNTFIFDIYNKDIYPHDEEAKKRIDLKVELVSGTGDRIYLEKLRLGLLEAFERFAPDLLIYNAGTDILAGDPLGDLSVSPQGILKRDEMVFRAAQAKKVPIVMLLSGGYQKSNAQVIADSIENLWEHVVLQR